MTLPRSVLPVSVLLLAALAGACASQTKLREAELADIEHWLPGRYDNAFQVEREVAAGKPPREAIDIVIVRISSMMIGKIVFYELQVDSQNPRRILRQRLHRFEASEDGEHILHSVLSLREPGRWIRGHLRPEIFKSLMPDDVTPGSCPLRWSLESGTFVGRNTGPCRASSDLGRPVNLETRIELTETELRVSERLVDSTGASVGEHADDPVLRFVKKAG